MSAQPTTAQTLARGSAWTALGQAVAAVSGLVTTVVAARVLDPKDFGLMGVAMLTISTLMALSRTGIDQALVQRAEADSYIDVAFTVQVVRGFLLAALVFGIAYPVSVFYDKPVLFDIFAVMSVGVLAGGFRNAATIFFQRTLNFRVIVLYSTVRAIFKMGATLILLLTLRSVWALVIGHVVGSAFDMVVSYFVQPYRPRLSWDKKKIQELLQFGKWISGMSVLGLVVTKGDDLFISKYLGMTALGLYTFAYEIANLPATNVTHVVGRVSFPTYSRLIETGDKAELRTAFLRVMKATILITAPLSVLLYLNAESIVAHVVGKKWEPIIPLVHILVLAGFVRSVAALAAALFQGAGEPHLDFVMNLPRFVLLIALIWPACAWAGLEGASWLTFLATSSCLPTWFYGLKKHAGVTFSDLVRENTLGMATTVVLTLCLLVSEQILPPTTLPSFGLQVALALGLSAAAMWVLGRVTPLRLFHEVGALSRTLRKRPA